MMEDKQSRRDSQSQQDKQGKRWLSRNVLGTGLTSLFSDMGHEMVTSLLPAILTSLGAPPVALGLVEGLSDLASSALKFWGGWFTDRPAGRSYRKPIVVVGYLATAFKALIAFAVTWPQVLLIRIIGWAGRGVRSPLRDGLQRSDWPRLDPLVPGSGLLAGRSDYRPGRPGPVRDPSSPGQRGRVKITLGASEA